MVAGQSPVPKRKPSGHRCVPWAWPSRVANLSGPSLAEGVPDVPRLDYGPSKHSRDSFGGELGKAQSCSRVMVNTSTESKPSATGASLLTMQRALPSPCLPGNSPDMERTRSRAPRDTCCPVWDSSLAGASFVCLTCRPGWELGTEVPTHRVNKDSPGSPSQQGMGEKEQSPRLRAPLQIPRVQAQQ